MTIEINEIRPGDQVTVQDSARNLAIGEVQGTAGVKWIDAFGQRIEFARMGTKAWRPCAGIRLVGHVPSMVPGVTR